MPKNSDRVEIGEHDLNTIVSPSAASHFLIIWLDQLDLGITRSSG